MPSFVKTGAMCTCMYGKVPLPLKSSQTNVMAGGVPALNIMDVPTGSFGMCNSPANPATKNPTGSAPCTPTLLPPMWLPGAPKALVSNAPALTDSSTLTCALGGPYCITILPPGAVPTVQV